MPKGRTTVEQLHQEREKLEAALRVERAADVVTRYRLPPSFVQVLAATSPEEQDAKAQEISRELAERTGDPAGSSDPVNQEHGGSPTELVAGGDASGEPEPEPENLGALAAITRSGAEGGSPPDPGPLNPKDAKSEAIRRSSSWEELETALKPGRG